MGRKIVNPWNWQDSYGFVQGCEVTGGERMLFCAGQTSVDGEGNPLYAGDMEAQINQAFDNLETVLKKAGYELSNIVRLNYYTTDVGGFMKAGGVLGERLSGAGCRPSSTLLGVAALFHPDLLVEIEATAVA
jgi:enamine deaminase RidA (YjgF/YER057c/UK114 family)